VDRGRWFIDLELGHLGTRETTDPTPKHSTTKVKVPSTVRPEPRCAAVGGSATTPSDVATR
jgi:hypothetical protein